MPRAAIAKRGEATRARRRSSDSRATNARGRTLASASPRGAARPRASPTPAPRAQSEAFATLLQLSHGTTLRIPPALLVEHVLESCGTSDWPVQRGAMEAVLRRCAAVGRDGLRIASHPARRAIFGPYTTRRRHERKRPYSTWLESLRPMRGSCDCPDYIRNSLGICKHLLTVIDDIARRPRQFARAMGTSLPDGRPRLVWDPVRPLTGRGDWLQRVRWIGFDVRLHAGDPNVERTRRWFRPAPDGELEVADAPGNDRVEERTAMVEDLLRAIGRGPREGRRPRGVRLAAEPALHALLAAERRHLERASSQITDRVRLERAIKTLHRRLYPYQMEGVRRFLAMGRLLLADDMGLGKTVQAVAACHALWHGGKVLRGLLIVPASLKSQWLREWRLFSEAPIEIVEGGPEARRRFFRANHGFLVVNYEQVLRDLTVVQAWKPDLVVLDEAQRIKNWATRTAACVKQLQPPYRLVLTGTPMENRLEELASILEWVDDHALEPKWRLVPWHAMHAAVEREPTGARNLDTLRVRLEPCMLRRTRREILHQLPPRTDTLVPVELTEEQRAEHDALNQPIAQLAATARKRPLTQAEFLKLMKLLMTQRMISNGLAQVRFADVWPQVCALRRFESGLQGTLHSPKLAELREIVEQVAVQQKRKIVVFSQWRRMLALAHWSVRDLLAADGLRAAFFTGRENPRQRTKNIVEFHDDPELRVLFATDAGGVGLNLQRAASCCINIELPWNPAVLEQRVGRIFRMGQARPIDVYNLVSQDCIESRIATVVADKRALFSGLFDSRMDNVRLERSGSFLSQVERLIESPRARRATEPPADPESVTEVAAKREIEALVAAAVESDEDAIAGTEPSVAPVVLPPAPPFAAVVAAGSEPALPALAPADVRSLFAQLEIHPTAQGGIRIEASPQAAATLAAVFEGLAGILRASERGS